MRASSLYAQGRAFNEPRHALAYRSEAAARHPGCISFGYFVFVQAKKSNPLAEGEWKLLLLKQIQKSKSPSIPAKSTRE